MTPQTWHDVNGKVVKVGDWCVVVYSLDPTDFMKAVKIVSGARESDVDPWINPSSVCIVTGVGPAAPGYRTDRAAYHPDRSLMLIEPDELLSDELAKEEELECLRK